MPSSDFALAAEPAWLQLCAAAGVDPQQRMQARLTILRHPQAVDCTLYRPDDENLESEETELGDARVLFSGPFQVPDDWSDSERAEYFAEDDPALFFSACIECEGVVGSRAFFLPEIGDHVACMTAQGQVVMYFVDDCSEDERGRNCVLIRDDEPLL